ncbi:MAG: MFS transporter [Bacteroidia bacterium]|nr:MFS transporter [Bacteroidia bacterium]
MLRTVLKNREYRFFLSARVLLTLALQIQNVMVSWQIFKLTNDPLSLGLIGLAEAIPALSIALYAGHLADKHNKRTILITALSVLLCCSVGILWVTLPQVQEGFSALTQVRFLYLFILISGFARGFYAPTAFSFLHNLVKREQLTTASTINSSSWQMASIIGPALGGFLFAKAGITVAAASVVFFGLLALTALFFIQPKQVVGNAVNETIGKRLTEGIRFVFSNKVILSALSLDLFAVLFGGAVALLPVFAEHILKTGPEGLGMLRAAPSLGASILMIWLSVRKPQGAPGIMLLWCVAGFGLCMIAFALSTNFYLSLFILFLSGAFDSVSVVVRGNILQLQTPDHMRGRVSAVNTMFIGSSNEIGAFESGVAAKLMGTVPSVIFGGCVTLLVVGITAAKATALKRFTYE